MFHMFEVTVFDSREPLLYCYFIQVFFRAGALGTLEEIRDNRLGMLFSTLQAWIRGFISRKDYKKLQEQRVSLEVVQRSLRKFMKMRTWPWFNMWQKVKPLLNVSRIEDEMVALEQRLKKAEGELDVELNRRKEFEESNMRLNEEKNNMLLTIESSKGNTSEFLNKQAKLQAQKKDLEYQLEVRLATYIV